MANKETKIILTLPEELIVLVQGNQISITGDDKILFDVGLSIGGRVRDEKNLKTTSKNKLLLM